MGKYSFYLVLFVWLYNSCTSEAEKPGVYTIEIKEMQFLPADITVKKGDTIIWINRDIIAHDVTEEDTKAWSSSAISPDQSWKMEVTAPANYYCSIHVVMKGRIHVE